MPLIVNKLAAAPFWTKVRKADLFGFRTLRDRVLHNTRVVWEYVLQRAGRVPKKPTCHEVSVDKVAFIQKRSVAPFVQNRSIPRQVFANLFPRVRMETVAADWRRRAAIHLASAGAGQGTRRLPLLAFVGLAFIDNNTDTNQLEKHALFSQIRNLYSSCEDASYTEETCNMNLSKLEFGELIDKGCHAAVYEARYVDDDGKSLSSEEMETITNDGHFNLAVKMMFNYDTESNEENILRAMVKEGVPYLLHQEVEMLKNGNQVKRRKDGTAHPNIVEMYDVFEDEVPDLPNNMLHYPAALPTRINPSGFGRNSTMFLVMKRYDCTLNDFLSKKTPSMDTRCLMMTQLLEGILFLQHQGIAHRDLKTDNILLDLTASEDCPLLIITDFGCCVGGEQGLRIPYNSGEVTKGGNAALMAPEIACAEVGPTSVLDYNKSDLWTAGALAYEIFGLDNPFYRTERKSYRLDSRTYWEQDLPPLPAGVPKTVQSLVQNLLCRNNNKRMRPGVAATVMQLNLWAPHEWIDCGRGVTFRKLQEWVVSCAAELICHITSNNNDESYVQNIIKQIFLSRISYYDLKDAHLFLQNDCTGFARSHL